MPTVGATKAAIRCQYENPGRSRMCGPFPSGSVDALAALPNHGAIANIGYGDLSIVLSFGQKWQHIFNTSSPNFSHFKISKFVPLKSYSQTVNMK